MRRLVRGLTGLQRFAKDANDLVDAVAEIDVTQALSGRIRVVRELNPDDVLRIVRSGFDCNVVVLEEVDEDLPAVVELLGLAGLAIGRANVAKFRTGFDSVENRLRWNVGQGHRGRGYEEARYEKRRKTVQMVFHW